MANVHMGSVVIPAHLFRALVYGCKQNITGAAHVAAMRFNLPPTAAGRLQAKQIILFEASINPSLVQRSKQK